MDVPSSPLLEVRRWLQQPNFDGQVSATRISIGKSASKRASETEAAPQTLAGLLSMTSDETMVMCRLVGT